jgi:hypothetical protein
MASEGNLLEVAPTSSKTLCCSFERKGVILKALISLGGLASIMK